MSSNIYIPSNYPKWRHCSVPVAIVCCLLLSFLNASAQITDTVKVESIIGNTLEDIIEQNESDEFDDDTFLEDLIQGRSTQVNINQATWEELEELDILNDIRIRNIIYYRTNYGGFKSPYELLGIEELTYDEIKNLLPYLTFGDGANKAKPLKEQFKEGKHSIFLRYQQVIEEKKGYTKPDMNSDGSLSSSYLGIEPRLYARYRFQYGTDLSIGITAEQDSGEPFRHPQQKMGLDYLSGHFFLKDRGILKRLVAGDFEVNFGQGLFLNQGYGSRKTSEVHDIKKRRLLFKPHTSANEIDYSTGLAIELALAKQWSLVLFGSYRKIDGNATLADTTLGEIGVSTFSSIQTSGYHRTESELEDKSIIGQGSSGISLAWSGQKARVATNASYFKFSAPLQRSQQPYNQFDFNGDQLINASVDYQYLNKNMSLFGEIAFSDNGGWGMMNGGNFHLPNSVKLTLAHRYYAKNFQTLYAEAFAESSRPVNENGLYFGLSFSPFKYAEWKTYVDVYKHPWLRFGIDGPSYGMDFLSVFNYRPRYDMAFYLRGRTERKLENAPDYETAVDFLVSTVKSNLRLNYKYRPNCNLSLQTRLEFSWYNDGANPTAKGFMFFQDIKYAFNKAPLTLYARYALFQTDSYDARIYAYESDLLYVFSVPAYYGRGSRYYLMAKIHINRYLDFWVRWSQNIWTDTKTVSSGLEEIMNNTKSEIKVQARIKF
ncbi:MAG: helix-hairpin-helix domain-containing protein [Bacteroidetes bacterium]|nr:helix-hairpin-helix domain-containing protein [Bacteroidota bacterium]